MITDLMKKIFGNNNKHFSDVSSLVSLQDNNYVSIEKMVDDYKQDLQSKYSVQTYSFLSEAIDYAYDGLRWHMSESSINTAASLDKNILFEDIIKIRQVWEECAPKKAFYNVESYLSQAVDVATDVNHKRSWADVELMLDIAKDYARLGNFRIPQKKLFEIRHMWEKNVSLEDGGYALVLDNNLGYKFNRNTFF
jgi:hypothetical protein